MPKKDNQVSLNEQLQQLNEILQWFENPNIDLDDAINKFNQGVEIAQSAKRKLQELENKITVLKQKFDSK